MSLSAASLSVPSHSLGRPIPYLPGGSWSYRRRLVWPLRSPTRSASHPKQGLSLPAVDDEDTASAGAGTGQTPRPGLWAAAQTVPEDGSGMQAPPSSLSWSGGVCSFGRRTRGPRHQVGALSLGARVCACLCVRASVCTGECVSVCARMSVCVPARPQPPGRLCVSTTWPCLAV